tara:strand:- start:2566 stop:3132 length:567 start_codon:yes stop_codon:yes gene_type:complete
MASTIISATIDGTYPVAGQDNDSQGFRDNFTIIKTGLATATTEITALQTSSAVLDAANNFSGNSQQAGNILQQTEAFYNGSTLSGNTNVSFSNGHYQAFTIGANVTLTLTDWPTSGKLAKMTVHLVGSGGGHAVTFTSLGSTFRVPAGFTNPTTVDSAIPPYIFDFWSYDAGASIYGEYKGQFITDIL